MKKQLLFLQQQMIDFEEKLSTLIKMAKLSGSGHKKAIEIGEDWDRIIKHFDEIQRNVTPVESLEVIFPKKSFTPAVLIKWGFWKDYLAEQHNIFMKSRMEITSLARLAELSDKDPDKAIKLLDTAMSLGWRNFFNTDNKESQKELMHENDLSKY